MFRMASAMLSYASRRFLVVHGGPVLSAVALAVLSILPVAWSLTLVPQMADESGWRRPLPWQALLVGGGAALISAVVAGAAGGWIRRRWAVTGAAVALFTAWPVAIGLLPLLGSGAGATVRYGVNCIDACGPPILSEVQPDTALTGWVQGLAVSMMLGITDIGAVLFGAISLILARRRLPRLAVISGVLAYASLHAMFFVFEPASIVGFVCLAVGVVIWWWWLLGRDRLLELLQIAPEVATDPQADT